MRGGPLPPYLVESIVINRLRGGFPAKYRFQGFYGQNIELKGLTSEIGRVLLK